MAAISTMRSEHYITHSWMTQIDSQCQRSQVRWVMLLSEVMAKRNIKTVRPEVPASEDCAIVGCGARWALVRMLGVELVRSAVKMLLGGSGPMAGLLDDTCVMDACSKCVRCTSVPRTQRMPS
jgi:hypothetical protein